MPFEVESTDEPQPPPEEPDRSDAPFRPSPPRERRWLREIGVVVGGTVIAAVILAPLTWAGSAILNHGSRLDRIEAREAADGNDPKRVSRADLAALDQKVTWIEQQLASLVRRFDDYLGDRPRSPVGDAR
jgi:hypothetical protein